LAVVNVPAAGVVPPIAGGDARYVLKPVPLTVELAESVVNAPVDAVVAPTVPLRGPEKPAAVNVVPSNVRFADPAKDPELLY
jgi:hypothetical protein